MQALNLIDTSETEGFDNRSVEEKSKALGFAQKRSDDLERA